MWSLVVVPQLLNSLAKIVDNVEVMHVSTDWPDQSEDLDEESAIWGDTVGAFKVE